MTMDSFNMSGSLLLIVGVAGATATLCVAIQKSECKTVSICYGCFKADRYESYNRSRVIIDQEKLRLGQTTSRHIGESF